MMKKNEYWRKWLGDQAWLAVAVTALTVLVGIAIAEVQTRIGWKPLAAALVLVIVIYVLALLLVGQQVVIAVSALADRMERTAQLPIDPQKIDWLLTTEQLADYERNIEPQEVWLLSVDLEEDSLDGPFQDVVNQNVKAGFSYHYFIPKTDAIKARVSHIRQLNSGATTLHFHYLPEEFFWLVPRFDIAIYNPHQLNGKPRSAYLGIPAIREQRHFHASVDAQFIDTIVGRVAEFMKDEVKLETLHAN